MELKQVKNRPRKKCLIFFLKQDMQLEYTLSDLIWMDIKWTDIIMNGH